MFFRQPVTPDAPWSFMFGTLMIFVNSSLTMRSRNDRVSSSPKKLVYRAPLSQRPPRLLALERAGQRRRGHGGHELSAVE